MGSPVSSVPSGSASVSSETRDRPEPRPRAEAKPWREPSRGTDSEPPPRSDSEMALSPPDKTLIALVSFPLALVAAREYSSSSDSPPRPDSPPLLR